MAGVGQKIHGEDLHDVVIVGSGFGGSVAALRLAEKGYSVVVLESGRRFADRDFAKTNWDLRRFLFLPRLGLRGIMRLNPFKGLTVLSGAGVGGGSLVYANTLMEPSDENFATAGWPTDTGVNNWHEELRPHYATARRMLGAGPAPTNFPADQALKDAATALGYGQTYAPVQVGVYFGEPGREAPDPYFGGEGPPRSGCKMCGGCMVGCRHNAKNTLVKNYLWLAERRGVRVVPDSEVTAIRRREDGYTLTVQRPGPVMGRPRTVRARRVVLAAGVLGTLRLLLRCREHADMLPGLSPRLGDDVRTNSESIIGVRTPNGPTDWSGGVAIAAGVKPDAATKIEAVRYPIGSDAMALLSMPLVDAPTLPGRLWQIAKEAVRRPVRLVRGLWPRGFARESVILLVMQSVDSKLRFRLGRRLQYLWRPGLVADFSGGQRPPRLIPEGTRLARKMAEAVNGTEGGSISDVLGMSITAHILGGCPMGRDADTGVIDGNHEVHGYPGLFVVGGAAVPANLGVNPSLTITAMAERAMRRIPAKVRTEDDVREVA